MGQQLGPLAPGPARGVTRPGGRGWGRAAALAALAGTVGLLAWAGGWPVLAGAGAVAAGLALGREWERRRHRRDLDVLITRVGQSGPLPERVQETAAWTQELGPEAQRLAQALAESGRRWQQALASTQARATLLDTILESLEDGVIAQDARGRIQLFNGAAERIFGLSRSEVLGRPLLEVIREYELAEALEAAAVQGASQTRTLRLMRPAERELQIRSAPLRSVAGGLDGAVAVLRDVTEMRRLEQVRTEFVANVSHELRTPLTAIKGFIETLLDGAVDDPATARRFLEIVRRETDRLVRLINDLLDLSRLESPHLEVQLVPVDLKPLVEECLELFRHRAASRSIELSCELQGSLWALGDASLIRQVLVNLVDNAVKYTPPGGRVWISGGLEGSWAELAVSDTGPGIPGRALNRVFERFYRVDKARSRDMGGTGLGLSIVRHAVERQGGRVWVESAPGEGSTFRVRLQAVPGKETA